MDKLEKHIKQKLQERELQPSDDAWTKIESQLGDAAKPKNRKIYRYAIAASFIGVLLLSAVYFNSGSKTKRTIEVVDAETKNTKEVVIEEIPNIEIAVTEEKVVEENKIDLIKKIKEPLKLPEPVQQDYVFNNKIEKEILVKEEVVLGEQELIDNKLNQVLNAVADLEQQNIKVTDAEIDSLLMIAQRELFANKVFQESGKVDAMALLTEVEDEMNRTFRGKVFEKLKEGFFKVRTAVADRNN